MVFFVMQSLDFGEYGDVSSDPYSDKSVLGSWVCLSNHIMCSGSMIEFTRLTYIRYFFDILRPLSNTKANYLVKEKSFLGVLHNPI